MKVSQAYNNSKSWLCPCRPSVFCCPLFTAIIVLAKAPYDQDLISPYIAR